MHDLVIDHAVVVDGLGGPARAGGVAIADGRIVAVGGDLGPARRRVDATSMQVVSRGVGDTVGGDAGRADTVSEVPSRDHPAAVRLAPGGQFGQFRGAERVTIDARAIDFAVVMATGDDSS